MKTSSKIEERESQRSKHWDRMSFEEKRRTKEDEVDRCRRFIRDLEEQRRDFPTWSPPYREIQEAISSHTESLDEAETWLATATEESETLPPPTETERKKLEARFVQKPALMRESSAERRRYITSAQERMEQRNPESWQWLEASKNIAQYEKEIQKAEQCLNRATIESMRGEDGDSDEELERFEEILQKAQSRIDQLPKEEQITFKQVVFSEDEFSEEEADDDDNLGDKAMEEEEEENQEPEVRYEEQMKQYEKFRQIARSTINSPQKELRMTRSLVDTTQSLSQLKEIKKGIKSLEEEIEEKQIDLCNMPKPIKSTGAELEQDAEAIEAALRIQKNEQIQRERFESMPEHDYRIPDEEEEIEEEECLEEEEIKNPPKPRHITWYANVRELGNDKTLYNFFSRGWQKAEPGTFEAAWCSHNNLLPPMEYLQIPREEWKGWMMSFYNKENHRRIYWLWIKEGNLMI
jgi:hypothetical protein